MDNRQMEPKQELDLWTCATCGAKFPRHALDGPDCTRCTKCVEVDVLTQALAEHAEECCTEMRAVLQETLDALDGYLLVEREEIGRLDEFMDITLPRVSARIRATLVSEARDA